LGFLCALLAEKHGAWILAGGFISLSAMLGVALYRLPPEEGSSKSDGHHPGLTTLIAALVMFAVGAELFQGSIALGIIIGGLVSVLLQMKATLHSLVKRMGAEDVRAIFRFALISLVILPVLYPLGSMGPYKAFNFFEIWLMVVLIVGISLGGYVLLKLFGSKAGTILGGILGGIISSTATSVSFARRTRQVPELAAMAAAVIMLATAIADLRLVGLAIAVDSQHASIIAWPLLSLFGAMILITVVAFAFGVKGGQIGPAQIQTHGNPAEMRPAIIFAILYAVITFAVIVGQEHFQSQGLYPIAFISGLTDLDAITLSTARLCSQGKVDAETTWRVIVVATLSNLLFKGGAVAFLGTRALAWRVSLLFGLSALAGLALLFFWP
jgi:uncharacterized membrane protein (DUF4010 family)